MEFHELPSITLSESFERVQRGYFGKILKSEPLILFIVSNLLSKSLPLGQLRTKLPSLSLTLFHH